MFLKKKKYFLNLSFFLMLLGVLMGLNSVSWLMMWLSMEITLMFFIPQMMLKKSMIESFSCLKYFIFQCLGSIFFILGSLNFFIFNIFGLFLKLGLFPSHFWMLSVSKSLNWVNFMFLMTIQKILPLMFLIFNMKITMFFFFILIFFNSLVGNLGSLNQMDLRLLMTFSSMNHMTWMIISTMFNMYFFYMYFMFYFVLMYFMFLFFNKMKIFFLFQIFYLKNFKLKFNYLFVFMLFFSFMGFPPFMGFLLKLISMMSLSNFYFFLFMFFMLMQNLFISFSYIRVMIYLFLNISRSMKMNKFNLKKYFNLIYFIVFLMLF
uniref:NADH dehydrogenase subunit 2 n=1 Tax=Pseudophilothrips ichini TaxID=754119 RepID=UPI0028FC8883|nr:NADH dehydrogenase subunit 2 [Pseudophilothrips ichini]WND64428.1 NADH dehydrogenase subunit 2 [Pseudophilothrips ichini]